MVGHYWPVGQLCPFSSIIVFCIEIQWLFYVPLCILLKEGKFLPCRFHTSLWMKYNFSLDINISISVIEAFIFCKENISDDILIASVFDCVYNTDLFQNLSLIYSYFVKYLHRKWPLQRSRYSESLCAGRPGTFSASVQTGLEADPALCTRKSSLLLPRSKAVEAWRWPPTLI